MRRMASLKALGFHWWILAMGRRAAARVSCRTMSGQSADVVICGGGVLGAALAYELAGRGARPLLIESRTIASGASGKAAGLLSPASDARAVGPLGELVAGEPGAAPCAGRGACGPGHAGLRV